MNKNNQVDLFDIAATQTAFGIREMWNIRIDVKKFAKYGQPEKSLNAAAKKLAALVASGDIEANQAEDFLKELHTSVEHLIIKDVDTSKLMKAGFSVVKRSLKEKAEKAKKAMVDKTKELAQSMSSSKGISRHNHGKKQIFQGLLFGLPEQKLHNADGWENIAGCWYLNQKAKFKCVAVEV